MNQMVLHIKNKGAERLARQLARETGESLTETVQNALTERWERLKDEQRSHALADQIEELLLRVDALPALDSRPESQILGYDEPPKLP